MHNGDPPVSIDVDPSATSEWTVSPLVFGKFQEHLRGAVYPGVYEDYLTNGSFEVWNESATGPMSGVVYPDVETHDGVAYPWEPVAEDGTPEHVEGGRHGRHRDDALDGGPEVPEEFYPDPSGVTEPRYQRVSIEGLGGVEQRLALPDYRVREFDATVTVRGAGITECRVALAAPDGEVLAADTVPVTDEWTRREVRLSLDDASPDRYRGSRYGEYVLSLTAEGEGRLELDWSTLIPADAVEGIYNPETIELLQAFDVTTIRWPGGNYASQVHWRDTVGPVEDRPVVPIVNWGGLEPNYLGTNEWLRFCELADVEPYVTVPFWSACGPEEAGNWVEYVNGSTDTEFGALRAEHGYEEPWDVTYWGVGNEVWGHWQVGHTDAETYGEAYRAYRDAMREADPEIEIDATGLDPWFTDVHDGSDEDVHPGEEPVWNEHVLRVAGETVEGLDVHRYTVGLRESDEAREAWLEEHGEDPVGYNEILVNFPAVFDRLLSGIEDLAAENGVPDLRLTIGEWNLGPATNDDWPAARTGTMAHAAYAAKTFQSFIRHGEHVEIGHWTDYTLYPHPRPDGVDPPHPGAYVQREMAAPLLEDDAAWSVAETAVESPTRPFVATGSWSRPADDVPLVDAVTIAAEDGTLLTYVTNGSLRETYEASMTYDDGGNDAVAVTLYRPVDDDPFRQQESWDEPDAFEIEERVVEDGRLELPPASFASLRRRS